MSTVTYNNSIVIQFDNSETGNAGSGKPVTVFDEGTTTKADLFDADGLSIGNPTQADEAGNYTFNIAAGNYDVYIDYGLPTQTAMLNEQIGDTAVSTQLIDDLSQAYEFKTLAAYKLSSIVFPIGKQIRLTEYSAGNGGGAFWTVLNGTGTDNSSTIRASDTVSQSIQINLSGTINTNQIGDVLSDVLIQAAIDTGEPNVLVHGGDWVYNADVILRSNLMLVFYADHMSTPAIDGLSLLRTADGSFTDIDPVLTENCRVIDFRFKMDGVSNCYGARVGNFRDNTGFFNCFGANDLNLVGPMDDRNNVGIELSILCWNTDLQNCYMRSGLNKSYSIRNGSNATVIMNCKSNTATTGIFIASETFATENTNIVGGYYQRAVVNIEDRGDHTVYNGPYLERPSVADINMDEAEFPVITSAHFTGGEDAPSVGIMARNVRGAAISGVLNTASRTNGLFDFDNTNEYCFASNQRSATLGTNIGNITGLKMKTNFIQSDAVQGDIGVLNNQIVARQGGQDLTLANNHNNVLVIGALDIDIGNYFGVYRKNVSGDSAFTISGTPLGGQSFRLVLFTTSNLSGNTITVDGRVLSTATATGGARTCTVEYTYIGDLSRWVTGPVSWEVS